MAKGGSGRGQGNGGGWPSTTGNPSGGGRSNNVPFDDDDTSAGYTRSYGLGGTFDTSSWQPKKPETQKFDILALSDEQRADLLERNPKLWEIARQIMKSRSEYGREVGEEFEVLSKKNLTTKEVGILNFMIAVLIYKNKSDK